MYEKRKSGADPKMYGSAPLFHTLLWWALREEELRRNGRFPLFHRDVEAAVPYRAGRGTAGDRKGRPYGWRRRFPIREEKSVKSMSLAVGAGVLDSPAVFLKVLIRLWANTYKKRAYSPIIVLILALFRMGCRGHQPLHSGTVRRAAARVAPTGCPRDGGRP